MSSKSSTSRAPARRHSSPVVSSRQHPSHVGLGGGGALAVDSGPRPSVGTIVESIEGTVPQLSVIRQRVVALCHRLSGSGEGAQMAPLDRTGEETLLWRGEDALRVAAQLQQDISEQLAVLENLV